MVRQHALSVATHGRGTYELTREVAALVADSGVAEGLCNVFVQHTSASLVLTENADPDVRSDLEALMRALVPDGAPFFRHDAEGPDDMAAHARSVLTEVSLTIPIRGGRCALGAWQGIYLWEHRAAAHRRQVLVTIYG